MNSPTLTALTEVRAVYLETDCLRLSCVHTTALPGLGGSTFFRQRVPTSRNWGGVQFLTRSHRTALTEQTGPVPRVITTPLYIVDIRSRLITSGDVPGGHRDDGSFD